MLIWCGLADDACQPDHGQHQVFSRDSACGRYICVKKPGEHVLRVPLRSPTWRGPYLRFPGKPHTCHPNQGLFGSGPRGLGIGGASRERGHALFGDSTAGVSQALERSGPRRRCAGGWLGACPSDADITGRGARLVRQRSWGRRSSLEILSRTESLLLW